MIPVYLSECTTWSDGEDHPEEDHNSYYDFEYFILEKTDVHVTFITVPYGIVMRTHIMEMQNDRLVRHIPIAEAINVLQLFMKYHHRYMAHRFTMHKEAEYAPLVERKLQEMIEMQEMGTMPNT